MKELVVPFGLLAVMGSLLLPVPPMALDFMLVGNLVLALVLFLSSLYVSDSLKLSSLPSLLLIATLYRLGLNVATTRAILSGGDAGQVVLAFGETVIAGNLAVGLVVFVVLTLIQFVVIAKGAERVAEVAARFTLDALPGKQMSIDADVRAGLIDFETARTRRNDLQTESRFFGALDGSMKFVKGDAIAGLFMVAVNIVGGLAVGTIGEGMSFSRAVQHFTLLTIGDGLASQIPALLNALAAGMVVTRVSRGDNQTLAQEVLQQLGQIRSVKVIIGLFIALIGIVPGMPALPFLSLSGVLLLSAILSHGKGTGEPVKQVEKFEPRVPATLAIEVGEKARTQLHGSPALMPTMLKFREETHRRHGLVIGLPEFEVARELTNGYRLKLRGIPVAQGVQGAEATQTLKQIFEALHTIVSDRMVELIDDIITRRMLDSLEREAPELIAAVVPAVVTVTQLTELLRMLAREQVSLKNFDVIVQAVAESGSKAANERVLLEEVRIALRRVISHQHALANAKVRALVLDPVVDLTIAQTERENRPLSVDVIAHIAEQLLLQHSDGRVLATSRTSRRLLADCLRLRGVTMPVIAFDELAEGYQFDIEGRVDISEELSAKSDDQLLGSPFGSQKSTEEDRI